MEKENTLLKIVLALILGAVFGAGIMAGYNNSAVKKDNLEKDSSKEKEEIKEERLDSGINLEKAATDLKIGDIVVNKYVGPIIVTVSKNYIEFTNTDKGQVKKIETDKKIVSVSDLKGQDIRGTEIYVLYEDGTIEKFKVFDVLENKGGIQVLKNKNIVEIYDAVYSEGMVDIMSVILKNKDNKYELPEE